MNRLFLSLVVLLALCVCAQAQQSSFTPNCAGVDDTSKFTSLISSIGANNGTISLPWKNGTRCAVNNLTIPGNVALDNELGTGIKVNAGQVLTVLGPVINPVGKLMFFGPGSTSFSGNGFVGSNGQSLTSDGAGGTTWTTISGGGGGGGAVESVFNRTGPVVAAVGDYTWAQINKSVSSLGDITLRSADLLSNGTTGTGAVVLADSATLISPVLTGATISSINGLTITPSTGTLTIGDGKTFTVSNTLSLAGASDGFTLTVPATGTAVLTSRTITEGAGLAGNTYDLSANRTLALGTPSTLSVASLTSVSGTTHSHAITSSANPGALASLLASDASGHLQLVRLGIATSPTQPLEVGGNAFINAATANLFMKDTSTGWQVANSLVITPQANNCIRSTGFTSGLVGWNICAVGDAEFGNVNVRGEIRSSVFKVNEIAATAGTFGVFFSASNLSTDAVIPASGSFTFNAKNSDAGGMLFAVGDIVRFKGLSTTGVTDTWATITARTNNGTTTAYTATLSSGSASTTYVDGSAVVDYGPSGTGFITLSADGAVGATPNLTMATHAGSPWSAFTTRVRLGNLNGSYGYATDVYGFGAGQFGTAGQSWLTVDPVNGVRIGNNVTVFTQVDASGNATFSGTITASAGSIGNWTINSTSLARDTGTNATSSGMAPADFPFFAGATVANRATAPFRVTPAGALTATNATITGAITATSGSFTGSITASSGTIASFTINSNRMSSGTTHLASSFDVPAGAVTWFGKSTGTLAGALLRDAANRQIAMVVGSGSLYPNIDIFDGVHHRVVLGGLNSAFESDGSTDSMGMKIWDSSGTLLVQFHDLANTIGNWNVTANRLSAGSGSTTVGMDATVTGGNDVRFFAGNATPSSAPFRVQEDGTLFASNASVAGSFTATSGTLSAMSITGLLTMSGVSSAITIGATPPTSAAAGTGLWVDRTGLYGLLGGATQAKIDATTGALTAGGGTVVMDNKGISILDGVDDQVDSLKFYKASFSSTWPNYIGQLSSNVVLDGTFTGLTSKAPLGVTNNIAQVQLASVTDAAFFAHLSVRTYGSTHATLASKRVVQASADSLIISTSDSVLDPIASVPLDVRGDNIRIATAKTPASASAACTQGMIAWDANFTYVCVATNTWKRSALSSW